jgi:hypothetical protein
MIDALFVLNYNLIVKWYIVLYTLDLFLHILNALSLIIVFLIIKNFLLNLIFILFNVVVFHLLLSIWPFPYPVKRFTEK